MNSGGGYTPTNEYKYPPRLYYLSYALGASFLLESCLGNVNWNGGGSFVRAAVFISRNSLWIYLLHIVFVVGFGAAFPSLHWLWRYLLVYGCALAAVILKNLLLKALRIEGLSVAKYFHG